MMLSVLLMAIAAPAEAPERKCDIVVGELVPNERIALALAEVVFRSRQSPERRSKYVVEVRKDGDTGWLVFQKRSDGPPNEPGYVTVRAGGGGELSLRIDRCDAAMINFTVEKIVR